MNTKENFVSRLKNSNVMYVLYQTFNSDLLFWVVIDSLFLTTVKGLSAFDIILVTMLGLAISLLFYPVTNIIVKKTRSKISLVLGSSCYVIAVTLFIFCTTIFGFVVAQFFYNLSSPLRQVSSSMLKNNLRQNGQDADFIKWQSYGKLGYSFITLIISFFAGMLFNVFAYLPMIFSAICAVFGLVIGLIYSEPMVNSESTETPLNFKMLISNKVMLLILLMNIIAVATYIFMHTKANLLVQTICEGQMLDIATTSLIVSFVVFGSRLCRVVSNIVFPHLYKKIENKSAVLKTISVILIIAGACFVVGANINVSYIIKLLIISIGFYSIMSVRDIYTVLESKIILSNIPEEGQKSAFVMAGLFEKFGRLIINGVALLFLGFFPLNIVYVVMFVLILAQIFISFALSKYLQ